MSLAQQARLLAAVSDPFATMLPEIDRCQRLSNAWDDMVEAALARDDDGYAAARARFYANVKQSSC